LPTLGLGFVRVLSRTWRVEVLGAENLVAGPDVPASTENPGNGGRLIALWHGRMLVGLVPHRDRGWSVLVSTSDDGDLTETLLSHFGYPVVRGSTSRRGAAALRELLTRIRDGGTVIITPDGPRGPRHAMNPGLAWMSRETGLPVIPGGFVCDRAWRLSSWDRFTVPGFRARLALVYGEPVRVPAQATNAELERVSVEIRRRMLAAEERGFAHLGVERDW